MKKKFLNMSKKIIKKKEPNISDVKLDEIAYGLESIYLTFTKMIVIITLSSLLGILKETFFLLICYNLIRITAFGLHATKSIYCLITSLLMFVGGVYLCNHLYITTTIKVILSLLCIICLYKYAPADTSKRPLVNVKKRKIYKSISVISGIIYSIFIIIFNDNIITNYLLLGMIEAILMIHPLIYKLFNLSYDNYKRYNHGV